MSFKILYLTDTQLTGKTPSGRNDIITEAFFKKLLEIGLVIKKTNIDMVIHGGDFFDIPRISDKLAGMIAEVISGWGVPVYVVPGNHDMLGYTVATVDQTKLGLLDKTGIVTLLTKGNHLQLTPPSLPNLELVIEGKEYHKDIDLGVEDDYMVTPFVATMADTIKILVPHGMIVDKPFHPDVPCTVVADIAKTTNADLVLCSHYHPGVKTQVLNGVHFYGPGALLRMENSAEDRKRDIKVGIIEIIDKNNIQIKDYVLKTARPGHEIFSNAVAKKAQAHQNQAMMNHFKTQLQQGIASIGSSASVTVMLQSLTSSNTSIPANVSNEAMNLLNTTMNNYVDKDLISQGFIPAQTRAKWAYIEIENFQSHKYTKVDFSDGLNVIIGESNSGKTAILRAARWCLYNDPAGSDFIRTGESDCRVKIGFTDGTAIERTRSRTSAGEYQIWNSSGVATVFKGFSNNIPVDIMNLHQMPKINITDTYEANINISAQLDGPFLLSASGFEKAAAIGKITGTDIVDYAIKENVRNALSISKNIKTLETQIESTTNQLTSYDYLNGFKLRIDTVDGYIRVIDEKQRDLALAETLDSDYSLINDSLNSLRDSYSKLPDMDNYITVLDELRLQTSMFESASDHLREYEAILFDKARAEKALKGLPDTELIFEKLQLCLDTLREITSVSNFRNELNKIHSQKSSLPDLSGYDDALIDSNLALLSSELLKTKSAYTLFCDFDGLKAYRKNLPDYSWFNEEDVYSKLSVVQETLTIIKQGDALLADMLYVSNSKKEQLDKLQLLTNEENLNEDYLKDFQKDKEKAILDMGVCPLCGNHKLTKEHAHNISKGGI